jgi:hypothetical protein
MLFKRYGRCVKITSPSLTAPFARGYSIFICRVVFDAVLGCHI